MDNTISLETFPNTIDAEIAKNLLEANGIRASIVVDDAGGMLVPMASGVKLMVLEENADSAREILRTAADQDLDWSEGGPAEEGASDSENDSGEDEST